MSSREREKGFPSQWLNRCEDAKDRESFKEYLLNCGRLFKELDYILTTEEYQVSRDEIDYTDSAWPYKAAHCNGMREMLLRVRKLIP